jgi:hypothetical protein
MGIGRLNLDEVAVFIDPCGGLAVGRPGDAFGGLAGEFAGMTEDLLNGPGMVVLGAGWLERQDSECEDDRDEAREVSAKGLTRQTNLRESPTQVEAGLLVKKNSKPWERD